MFKMLVHAALVALLLAAGNDVVTGAAPCPHPNPNCPARPACDKASSPNAIKCIQHLVKPDVLFPLLMDSHLGSNGIGNYYGCTNKGHAMCPMSVVAGEFILYKNGLCLPAECREAEGAIQAWIDDLTTAIHNKSNSNCTPCQVKKQTLQFIDECISTLPNATAKRKVVATELAGTVYGLAADVVTYTAVVGLEMDFRCGLADYANGGGWDFGAIVIVMMTVAMALAIVGATQYKKRGTTRGGASVNGDVYEDNDNNSDDKALIPGSIATGSAEAKLIPLIRNKVLQAWNFDATSKALFAQSAKRTLTGLDGLKTISMIWIILGHTCLLSYAVGESASHLATSPNETYTRGVDAYTDVLHTFEEQFQINADKAVDTFFLISFMLMGYTVVGRLRKGSQALGKLPAQSAKFLVLRWLRLTPLYAFVLFFYSAVIPYLTDGPFWYRMVDETGLCREKWWTNLLYINNFHPTNFHDTCMSWTWYLANDMQFFCVGLAFLYVYIRNRMAAYVIAAVASIASIIAGYSILYNHPEHLQDWYYDKPYMRVTPVLIGLCLGVTLKDTKLKDVRISKVAAHVLMGLSISVILISIYGNYFEYNSPTNTKGPGKPGADWDNATYAAYEALGRIGFSLALAVLIILGISKNGGFVYAFLSLGFWEPLGKLTYGAYLIHPILLRAYYYQMTTSFDFDVFSYTIVFVAVLTLSYGLSMVLHLMVELPFANLIKLIM